MNVCVQNKALFFRLQQKVLPTINLVSDAHVPLTLQSTYVRSKGSRHFLVLSCLILLHLSVTTLHTCYVITTTCKTVTLAIGRLYCHKSPDRHCTCRCCGCGHNRLLSPLYMIATLYFVATVAAVVAVLWTMCPHVISCCSRS
jgi:hypothetical protein